MADNSPVNKDDDVGNAAEKTGVVNTDVEMLIPENVEHDEHDEHDETNPKSSTPIPENATTPCASKRKAPSPLFNTSKKLTPARKPRASRIKSFADQLRGSFEDPSFATSVSPLILSAIVPSLQKTIELSVTTVVDAAIDKLKTNVLDQIISSNSKLQEAVVIQNNLIQEQKAMVEEQAVIINQKVAKIEELEQKVDKLESELKSVKLSTNDLEQYGRRNSLRFMNMKLEPELSETELTKQLTGFINKHMLKQGPPISVADIDRCHPVGRPNLNGNRQILVKFNSYHTKQKVYGAKSSLKSNRDKVFVSEDLTRYNFEIIKSLLPLKKSGKIYSFWSTNGNVLAKLQENSRPVRLRQTNDIKSVIGASGSAHGVD